MLSQSTCWINQINLLIQLKYPGWLLVGASHLFLARDGVTRFFTHMFCMILNHLRRPVIYMLKYFRIWSLIRGDIGECKNLVVSLTKMFKGFFSVKRDSFNHFSWLKLIWVRDSWAKSFYEEAISAVSLTPLSQALQCQWHRWRSLLGVRYLCHDLRQVLSIPNC